MIVVTDRRLLNKQLRDNIRDFSEVKNIVASAFKSSDLKAGLENGKKIINTSPESRNLWLEFTREYVPRERSVWKQQDTVIPVKWAETLEALPVGSTVRLVKTGDRTLIFSTAMNVIGEAQGSLVQSPRGVLVAKTTADHHILALRYYG